MGRVNVQPARSAGGGLWKAMLIGLVVIVLAALAVYFVVASGTSNYSPTAPNVTSAPGASAPASAGPAITTAPGPRYP
jgi:hypothetical protein